ncbi:MAG TPA: hypothetical protein VK041_06255 [Opitutales bacterium]|nr:hypothetical protein [Opitutales bacterium]
MKILSWSRVLTGMAAFAVLLSAAQAASDILIDVQKGDLPIVISAPHGGSADIPGGEEKTEGTTVRDMNTEQLAKLIADRLAERLNGKPHYVIAQFSRRYVDANRGPGFSESQAYGGPVSKVQYDAFHNAVRAAVSEIRETSETGLLIDLHGQSRFPGKMIRGTVNGQTVASMLDQHGIEALIGPESIFGKLAEHGFGVEPPVEDVPESPKDEEHFIGGYIVRAYGSHNADGIDSIQVEVGRDFRHANVLEDTAEKIADSIAVYTEKYLLAAEVAAD